MYFKILGKFWGIFYVFNYKSTTTSIHTSRAIVDTCNFANCFILPYSISAFKLNNNAWVLSSEPWTENDDDVEQDELCIGDDPCAILDQYLGEEELEELILEEGSVFDNDLP